VIDAKEGQPGLQLYDQVADDRSGHIASNPEGVARVKHKNRKRNQESFVECPVGGFEYGIKKQEEKSESTNLVRVIKSDQIIQQNDENQRENQQSEYVFVYSGWYHDTVL
jgi:hypothetical protein